MLLFFYGGGWQTGNRGDYLAFGQAFASAGIGTRGRLPALSAGEISGFVEDGGAALAFVHAHAADYGGDPAASFSPAIRRAPTMR